MSLEYPPIFRDMTARPYLAAAAVSAARLPPRRRTTSKPDSGRRVVGGITYTKTGRISKAKKGIKGAHVCKCGKEYSRAEHLRRHQQNHGPTLSCKYADCGKTFHRQDLLQRHEDKHLHPDEDVRRPAFCSTISCEPLGISAPSTPPVAYPAAPAVDMPPEVARSPTLSDVSAAFSASASVPRPRSCSSLNPARRPAAPVVPSDPHPVPLDGYLPARLPSSGCPSPWPTYVFSAPLDPAMKQPGLVESWHPVTSMAMPYPHATSLSPASTSSVYGQSWGVPDAPAPAVSMPAGVSMPPTASSVSSMSSSHGSELHSPPQASTSALPPHAYPPPSSSPVPQPHHPHHHHAHPHSQPQHHHHAAAVAAAAAAAPHQMPVIYPVDRSPQFPEYADTWDAYPLAPDASVRPDCLVDAKGAVALYE